MSDLVGNPEDRFSRVEAHISHIRIKYVINFEARKKAGLQD